MEPSVEHLGFERLPRNLQKLRGSEQGSAWLDSLPQVAKECAERWGLVLGRPFDDAYVSLPLRARQSDGTEVVLKIQFPHDHESEHEAAALSRWNGEGAVRLLAHDPDRHALLLERCTPGTYLSRIGQEQALDVLVDLLPRLWKPADTTFRPLTEEAGQWATALISEWERAGKPFDRAMVDFARDTIQTLSQSQGEQVLLHQDLHGDNVLRAQRQPWLAIDPKPLLGEREFSVAPIVRSSELGQERGDVLYRLNRLTADLGLDRERARLWTIAQSLAWGVDSEWHIAVARWLK